jgi:hypothetical protein
MGRKNKRPRDLLTSAEKNDEGIHYGAPEYHIHPVSKNQDHVECCECCPMDDTHRRDSSSTMVPSPFDVCVSPVAEPHYHDVYYRYSSKSLDNNDTLHDTNNARSQETLLSSIFTVGENTTEHARSLLVAEDSFMHHRVLGSIAPHNHSMEDITSPFDEIDMMRNLSNLSNS